MDKWVTNREEARYQFTSL